MLPIYDIEIELLAALKRHRRVIVQAPTGSGKSTQIPQMLHRRGLLDTGQAVILQPRRLAARMLAARVAQECHSRLGDTVGYQIRFDNQSGPDTRIRFVTEGILLRQMLSDPMLRGVNALIFDEFHERHLYGDITLARALDLQETHRPDLLILVMSATLDTERLRDYLAPCDLITSEGRTYPVNIHYLPKPVAERQPIWDAAAEAVGTALKQGAQGDGLVFMPGSYEIHRTLQALERIPQTSGFALLPLHGELTPRDQDAAVTPHTRRKIVVATNVAETSLTIDGIRFVVDSGLARIPRYDPYRGINTLLIEKISRASADQRAGRAGRTAPGDCHRLWTEREHGGRALQELPEIRRLDLAEVILTLKAAEVHDLTAFRWLEPPDPKSLARALLLLTDLGAITSDTGPLTDLGRRMLAFPVHPRYARMLLAAAEFHCVRDAALIAALTQGRDLLIRKPGKDVEAVRADRFGEEATSDFFIIMRAWEHAREQGFRYEVCRDLGLHAQNARQTAALYDQFLRLAKDEGLPLDHRPTDERALRECLLLGFSDHLAHRLDRGTLRCDIVHGRRGVLARESAVQNHDLLVAADIREIEGREKSLNTLLSLASAVEPEWLEKHFPHDLTRETRADYDTAAKRVIGVEQVRFRDLVLSSKPLDKPPPDEAARLLADEVLAGRLTLKGWTHAIDQWILRLNRLAEWCPDLALPPIGEDDRKTLIQQICFGHASYKDIKELDVRPVVYDWLSWPQRQHLDQHAPERVTLANGRSAKVTYLAEGHPFISLRIQELYDVPDTPRIAMGRVPLLVHILAPSMRPVQITQDLAGFWRDHYPKVKQELQRKYPKHAWR